MSTLHQDRGRADADTTKGELRKPHDYSNQPGQGESREPGGDAEPSDREVDEAHPPAVGVSTREYAHSSGDRNTMRGPRDWHEFEGGVQRDAVPDAPLDPEKRPNQAQRKRGGGPSGAGSGRRS